MSVLVGLFLAAVSAGGLALLGEGKTKTIGFLLVWLAGWAWALLAGVGGLILLIHEGPIPVTHGWFAMFSGFAACPLTATLLRKHAGVSVAGWAQFAVALLIFLVGRVAVVLVLHRPFLPQ
jgi:hypothetical protein